MLFQHSSIFNFDFINRQPFLALQTYPYMRKLTNTRQKLIINRRRKNQTPPKLEIEVRNGTTAIAWAPRLTSKDTNVTKLSNSSILKKQNCVQTEKKEQKEKNRREMIRCRSNSVIVQHQKSKSKFIPPLPTNTNSEEKCPILSNRDEAVYEASKNMIAKMQQKGTISIKNNYYLIHHENLLDAIAEIVEKVTQPSKDPKDIQGCSQVERSEPETKIYEAFNVFNQYSIQQTHQKMRRLAQHSHIVDQHHAFEEDTTNRQTFWRIVNNQELQQPSQRNLAFLLSKIKYLKKEAKQQETCVRQLNKKIEELNSDICNRSQSIEAIQQKRAQCSRYLQEIQETAKQMENFIDKQPNRILQLQAKEYKQRQQELFDLAFQYQQQTPSSMISHIEESIMIPFESFKLTIQSFPQNYVDAEDCYTISKKSMDDFKASLRSAYDSTIAKLSAIIDKKAGKIKNFVGIMRRLASYTIGKREYLSEINKKMSVVSIHIDKNFKSLEGQLIAHSLADNVLKKLGELKQLFQNIKNIYCEAQVFY